MTELVKLVSAPSLFHTRFLLGPGVEKRCKSRAIGDDLVTFFLGILEGWPLSPLVLGRGSSTSVRVTLVVVGNYLLGGGST